MNTLMPHLCPSPISGKSTYNVCNPNGRDSWKSSRPPPSLEPCGNSTGQAGKYRVPSMEYHNSGRESKDCLDFFKRMDSLALSACQTRLVWWSSWEYGASHPWR